MAYTFDGVSIKNTVTQEYWDCRDPHYTHYLNKKLDKLQYEKQLLLKKLGITGDLL